MKLITFSTEQGIVLGIEHELGRIERIAIATDGNYHAELLKRIADCFNALDRVSPRSLQHLLTGGGTSGTAAERLLAWSIFVANARVSANRFLDRAREQINKQGGA